jgi:hypothetical protein
VKKIELKKMALGGLLLMLSILNINANENNEKRAREIIATFQKEIYSMVVYKPEELKKRKVEFIEYYKKNALPRLLKISENISPNAIHWVDLNWDQKPELIFWTEGLAPTAWGGKEVLIIIEIMDNGKPKIMRAIQLDNLISRGVEKYQFVRFWAYPNEGKGYNDYLGAVFSYAVFGASSSGFINYEIGWDKYSEEIFVRKFSTSFPIDIKLTSKISQE